MENKSYDIEGMSCASCSQAVEKAAAKVAGVKEATVNLATEKLTVAVDESHFSEEILKNAVDAAGYVLVANKKEKTFLIEGMSCASCSQTVEKVTRAVAGVSDASVNLATEKMVVSYDPTVLHAGDIERVVAEAGYKAIEENATIEESDQNQAKKEQAHQKYVETLLALGGIHGSASVSRDGPHVGVAVADEPPSDYVPGHVRAHAALADDSGDGARDEIFYSRIQVLVQRTPEYGLAGGFGDQYCLSVQPIWHLCSNRREQRTCHELVLRIGGCHFDADHAREVLRGRFKRQDIGGHQKTDGLGA